MLDNPDYRIERGVVLSRSNVERAGAVTYLPIYASWCLKEICGLLSPDDNGHDDTDSFSLATIPV
ncbi:hypothetical protein [Bifidobacterium stellenboschense]|uniref:Uncharacterized protein n=1 Tax=Bifidobacterium stellenboschense TaxID=762211 RepID=A0A087E0Y8_9BIFI|nr:hypothetical protein [Bifidobacterium stellenboschense]KFJ01439.1 hypothetical protein BSTEL_1025 [Bifidobacterium stellenboschense]